MNRKLAGVLVLPLLALAAVWVVFASLAATPCGVEGEEMLRSTSACPVKPHHVLSVVLGFGGTALLVVGAFALLAYAVSGSRGLRKLALRLLLGSVALAILWMLGAAG